MTDTATQPNAPGTELADFLPMQEVAQGDHARIEALFGSLMSHEIPAFVIRASLNEEELATVNQAIASNDTLFVDPLAKLHNQARGHLESTTPHSYSPLTEYKGQQMTDSVQINNMKDGKGIGGHTDASPFNPPEHDRTAVAVHTVTEGNVDVSATGYNYKHDPQTGEVVLGTLDPTVHKTSLTQGDSIVFRPDGKKPTHHDFVSPNGEDRVSAIQTVRPNIHQ